MTKQRMMAAAVSLAVCMAGGLVSAQQAAMDQSAPMAGPVDRAKILAAPGVFGNFSRIAVGGGVWRACSERTGCGALPIRNR